MDSSQSTESFRSLLLRDRGLSGLSQRDLAARLGAGRRTVQDWEAGLSYPSAERLQSLIQALLEAGGLMAGREAAEAQQLWAAVLREAPRMHTPFDEVWLARLLADRGVAVARLAEAGMPAGVSMAEQGPIERDQDWGAAPDVLGFVGRTEELATRREWVLEARLRLAAVLGMGGIGKTVLAARLAQDIAPKFERLYWRSLRDAPSISDWLAGAIGFLSGQQLLAPEGESAQLRVLLELLREQSSLLVLDNFETVLEPGDSEGRYRDGYEGYGRLLQAMGEGRHQSCLLVTSREAPRECAIFGGGSARTLQLGGLGVVEGQVLLADKRLSGNASEWTSLVDRFGGNGLALKVVGERIRELFGGELSMFLSEAGSGRVFGGIRRLLIEQLERSSGLEQKVLRVLAVEREPVTLAELLADLGVRVRRGAVLEAVEALRRRSLVERAEVSGPAAFTLQSVVLEYVTDRLVDEACGEITAGRPALLVDQPLIKAQAKDYVRQSQERLIGSPILQQLKARHDERGTADRLVALLDHWRGQPFDEQGYGPGNIVNLLRLLRGDLRGLDFSRLAIRQGYLAEVDAQDASLVDAYGAETVLAEAFHFPVCVAVSADGALLAAGTSTGAVCVWRVTDRTPLWVAAHAHAGTIRGVAFSRDGQLVATGGEDGTMRLWAALTGRPSATLPNDTGTIGGVALSADGHLLAGGSGDGTVRLWEDAFPARDPSEQTAERINQADKSPAAPPNEWRALAPLRGHTGAVWSVGLSADSRLVVSGGDDGTVRVWEARTGRPLATLQGHTGTVWGVALSADGQLVVSGGGDGTVRLWEARTGRPLATLQGHTGTVWGVATSADGQLVISAGADATLRMWSAGTARPLATLQGYSGTVWCVGLSDDGHRVVSGDGDGTLRLWEPGSPRPLASVHGHTGTVWGLAVSADGRLVVSGGEDGMVHLWEVAFAGSDRTDQSAEKIRQPEDPPSGWRPLATLEGHSGTIRDVALSSDGHLVASGCSDGTVRLWETSTRRPVATLHGHSGTVWSVAISADGHLVVSGGADGTLRLWEFESAGRDYPGQPADQMQHAEHISAVSAGEWRALATLRGHTGTVWGVALSRDGHLVVSSGEDGTVRLWEARTGRLLAALRGHTGTIRGLAVSADGRLVVSGGADGTVRMWDAETGRPFAILQGHTGTVWGVALSVDGELATSGSFDGTVKLWDAKSGACLRTLEPERRYERLNITGLNGITEAQRQALIGLGAIDLRASQAGA